jgi:hypothetical protein
MLIVSIMPLILFSWTILSSILTSTIYKHNLLCNRNNKGRHVCYNEKSGLMESGRVICSKVMKPSLMVMVKYTC